jgi:hypothetical protein
MKNITLRSSRYFLLVATLLLPSLSYARSVYVNGIDISSARNQSLKNVHLRIDENGHVYIEAPHYQVNEEQTFTPLSSLVEGIGSMPKHKEPQALPNEVHKAPLPPPPTEVIETEPQASLEKEEPKLQNKPGVRIGG